MLNLDLDLGPKNEAGAARGGFAQPRPRPRPRPRAAVPRECMLASAMSNVYIESADIDLGDGENFMFVKKMIPDIKFSTSVGVSNTPAMNIVVKKRNYNSESLSTDSTSQITNSTTFASLRTRTRQMVLRFESDDDNSVEANKKDYKWRLGNTRLDMQPSGRRG